jgi:hypothetical protein
MALPTSGPLSLNDIAGEFGGSVPHSLSEYYGAATGIPTSGTISIGDFYGASASLTVPIDFYQHAYGSGIGSIVVYIVDSTGAIITPISGGGYGGMVYTRFGQYQGSMTAPFTRAQVSPVIAPQSYRILWLYYMDSTSFRADYAIRDAVVGGTTYDFASNANGWLTTTSTSTNYPTTQAAFSNASAVATGASRYTWNRRTGTTPSGSTGPSTPSGVYYLYAESSSSSVGDIFYLFSPLVTQ